MPTPLEPSRLKRSKPEDVKMAAQAYFFGGQYQRGAALRREFAKVTRDTFGPGPMALGAGQWRPATRKTQPPPPEPEC